MRLSYELAKRLKDSGFPQGGDELTRFIQPDGKSGAWHATSDDAVKVPTLSELIEACGKHFWKLEATREGEWLVESPEFRVVRKTPEEVLVRLYLKLNEIS